MALEQIRVAPYFPVGAHTANTSLTGVVTVPCPEGATGLLVQAADQNIRFTLDGSGPTSTSGFVLKADDPPVLIPLIPGQAVLFTQETATAQLQYQAVHVGGGRNS